MIGTKIKVVLVDDERPAIKMLEILLSNYDCIEICGTFLNPLEAVNNIQKLSPDTIFLDVGMPQMMGIDVASVLLDHLPETEIVFVTGFNEYAVEAFELYALDYLIKPVSKERLDKTIKRIASKKAKTVRQNSQKKLFIKTLGGFSVGWVGEEPIKWRTQKTKEIFAYLLHNANRTVTKEEIVDAIFYHLNTEKAMHQLHNGIYHIRKAFDEYGIDSRSVMISGNYMLHLGDVDMDIAHFTNCMWKSISGKGEISIFEEAVEAYTGDYFEFCGWDWAYEETEKLARQYVELVLQLSDLYFKCESYSKAEGLLLKTFKRKPCTAEISMKLIETYIKIGRKDLLKKHYEAYKKALKEELGVRPEAEIERIVQKYF